MMPSSLAYVTQYIWLCIAYPDMTKDISCAPQVRLKSRLELQYNK
jgi:hypothetical protein